MSTAAEQLRDEADKLESSKGGFFSKLFGGGDSKLEEACDLYTRAGSRFKGMIIFVFFDESYDMVHMIWSISLNMRINITYLQHIDLDSSGSKMVICW